MASVFENSLEFGRVAEGRIADFLYKRGCAVLPVYELEGKKYQGPQLFTAGSSLVAPDMLAFTPTGNCVFCEAKHKSHFTWYRREQVWQTGIDSHHFDDYLKVQSITTKPVWILFLHCDGEPWHKDIKSGSPIKCPTGLYGEEVRKLAHGRRDSRHGSHGMIYWSEADLQKLCGQGDICL